MSELGSVSLTGKDTFIMTQGSTQRILKDFADADCGALEFPNDAVTIKKGKGGNAVIAYNAAGEQATMTFRIVAGSSDDKHFNSLQKSYINDPPSFVLPSGEFIKRAGDGQGNVNSLTYTLAGMVPKKIPAAKENVEGDSEQAVAVWVWEVCNGDRSIT